MNKKVTLSVSSAEGKTSETITASFEEKELDVLCRFMKFCDRLGEASLVRKGIPHITNMSINATSGVTFQCEPSGPRTS